MTKSSLASYTNITKNHSSGRSGQKVCKITPHYMSAKWSGKRCADYFAETDRQCSSNYCIGVNGDIAMSVDEDDRAWTSSSSWNDSRAITIECGNLADSSLTDATWNSLVSLCADICKRYGFRLEYTGDRYGTLTEHRMFSSTDCPGKWLHSNMSRLAREVNAKLDGTKATTTKKTDTTSGGFDMATLATVKKGSKGATVKSVQALLNAKNSAGLAIDGDAGTKTDAAIKAYQKKKALAVDGQCGPKTWAKLLTE